MEHRTMEQMVVDGMSRLGNIGGSRNDCEIVRGAKRKAQQYKCGYQTEGRRGYGSGREARPDLSNLLLEQQAGCSLSLMAILP